MFGSILFGQTRFGDDQTNALRPLYVNIGVSYTISTSKYAGSLPVTYQLQGANAASALVYYQITPVSQFAIDGDSSIVAPDSITYTPRPVTAHTLVGSQIIQGFPSMTWNYTVLFANEFQQIISHYHPANPLVTVVYPNEDGMWMQEQMVLHPPNYGVQTTTMVNNVTLVFSHIL